MSSPNRRSLEVDFFRGLVLLVIAVDHISGSVLSRFTLHSYAFCDSAEVFVFLGGYASAAAYTSIESNRSHSAALRRFLKRSWEIYRAYLFTAVMMLLGGALLMWMRIDTPMLQITEWPAFLARPLSLSFDIATLRHQPYLSSVLPMYAMFALAVPFVVPLAEKKPVVVLFGSLGMWLFASSLAQWLPSAYAEGWSFNPFAWQLMFVLGLLSRVQPISAEFHNSKTARWLTRAAILVFLTFAFAKLFLETQAPPGYMKQNLATLRIVSFVVVAWLFAQAVHAGWIRSLAQALPSVVNVGKQGLVCFIAGACMSLVIDSALRVVSLGSYQWMAGLTGDAIAIGTLIWLAAFWRDRKAAQLNRVPKHPAVPAHATNRRDR
ncbi:MULTISPECIES: OpgC domain-containing protein [Burkholderiaceae]|uniref:OpgC protein n=1 Tax=Caballeronia sordidicola TaxID=196367 RepID=A0A242MGI7_CABSO|nr:MULTISPECIES: OpgC domain-containing protein [Burkholderiaceae]AME24123.1 OpgC protein [Burkholderia sp. PAMC 26561]OTP70068.1 OpgC protein [Caballeronia sordidicola]